MNYRVKTNFDRGYVNAMDMKHFDEDKEIITVFTK
jgi:hypothetical protein